MSRTRFMVSTLILVLAAGLSAQTRPAGPETSAGVKPLSDLKIELMDGSVLTGKLSISALEIDTKFGALKVPVDQIQSFAPGLQSHPQFLQQVNALVADLSSEVFADREKAQQALIKLGPDIRPELERQLKGAENEKQLRLQKIIDEFESMVEEENVDKVRAWSRDDVIVTPGFTIVGRITTPGFSINSNYGTLQIKLEDVRLARREVAGPEEIRKTIGVPGSCFANRQYVNTNIKLAKGDQVFITASGSIHMSPWNQPCSPDGSSNFGNMGGGLFGGTLIGRIGDSGPTIKIGSKLNFTASQAGTLQLSVASTGNYAGNDFPGQYDVKIRVVKK